MFTLISILFLLTMIICDSESLDKKDVCYDSTMSALNFVFTFSVLIDIVGTTIYYLSM